MYMFMFFKYSTYHICQLLYYSMVCTRYIHGTDMSVQVYARWSGFQMSCYWDSESCRELEPSTTYSVRTSTSGTPIFGICLEYAWYIPCICRPQ